jgi:CHAT domain-containing protein
MGPILAMLLATGAQAPVAEVVDLEIGTVLEVEQRADETRVFRIELEAGRAYLLEVGQRELDVIVEVTAPDGSSRRFDAPLLRFEPERLLIEPHLSGIHAVSLSSNEYKGRTPRVTLQVSQFAPQSEVEQQSREALAAETQAAEANFLGGIENWRASLEGYRTASNTWRGLGILRPEARARLAQARLLHSRNGDWHGAARAAEEAAKLYASVNELGLYASALHLGGAALIEAAEFDQAQAQLKAAIQIREDLDDAYQRAKVINQIGLLHYTRSEWALARRRFEEAAREFHHLEEWTEELMATASVAAVDYSQGSLVNALTAYRRVLSLLRSGEKVEWRAGLLDNMAAAYRALGNADEALASYANALALHEARDSPEGRGRSLSGIGVTYYGIGELELARKYLERAIPFRRLAHDRAGQVYTLLFLGAVYLQQGDVARATEAHSEAVQLAASPRERARARVMLARALGAFGQGEEALDTLDVARQIAMDARMPVVAADALLERGRLLITRGRNSEAKADLKKALEIYNILGWLTGEAQVLHQLALALRAEGDPARAAEFAAASIKKTEQLRNLIVNPDFRASFLATQRDPYTLQVSLAVELAAQAGEGTDTYQEWARLALATSERARTRATLDRLHETAAGTLHKTDPELTKRRRKLYQELAGLRFYQSRLLEREEDHAAVAEARASLDRVESELNILESEIRKHDPKLTSLAALQTLDAAAIQATLSEDWMLLQYELGDEQSWLFVVSGTSVSVHQLPPRAEIETLARRAHELLRTRDEEPGTREEREKILNKLSELLINPARPLTRRLVIAADGALHYLPFATLPAPDSNTARKPLVADHELVSVPSVSVVATRRQLIANRASQAKAIAIFADPVFQRDDPRMAGARASASTKNHALKNGQLRPAQWAEDALHRLPASAKEVETIAALVPGDQRLVATGFDASRSNILNANLADYRILHFATHALVDDRYPSLSALVFSRFDVTRAPVEGFLWLHDLYGLELGADLITLSACDTALGQELRGEGLIGLALAFLHAGGGSVVASLWKVSDQATAELMRVFYEHQLTRGLSPAAALRLAQLHVSKQRRWQDPYFWAAFVTYGEWWPGRVDKGEITVNGATLSEQVR